MKQSELGLNRTTKRTRKREFLDEMDHVVPWTDLVPLVAAHAPEKQHGCRPLPIETMLRIHFMQQWFGLSDPAVEEALRDTPMYREFVRLDDFSRRLPDETTILRFRHLLEEFKLADRMLQVINDMLRGKGLMTCTGTAVHATLIAAPSSTKNAGGKRDPDMHRSKMGTQWHFGMKAHISVDAGSSLVHTVLGTSGNVNDVTRASALLQKNESVAFADAGYQRVDKWPEADGRTKRHVAMRAGKRKTLDLSRPLAKMIDQVEKIKASIRAKVEHPFRLIKQQFGHTKVRYRSLAKNTARLQVICAVDYLRLVRKTILQGS